MKTLKLTVAILLFTISAFAQSQKPGQKLIKVYPCFNPESTSIYTKEINSIKAKGYVVTGLYRIAGTKTCRWTFLKIK